MANPDKSPLGVYSTTSAYTRGWPAEWRGRYIGVPPWQHNFLIWSISHAVDQGYPRAIPFRDFLMRFPIGLVSNSDQITPHAGGAYVLFVAKTENKKRILAGTWKEVDYLTYEAPKPVIYNRPTKTQGDYSRILRAVLADAARSGVAGARAAFDWVDAQQQPALRGMFQVDPTWALSP
jgi:hypothetical protein